MKNKSGIIWPFIFFIMVAGCSTHQQLAGIDQGVTSETPQGPGSPGAKPDTVSESSFGVEDEEGYQIRPIEIEIEGGRPYLPVGAEFITQDGKVSLGDVIKAMADHKGFSVSWADDVDQQRPVDCHIQAADNFYDALDNILRQLDYFYAIEEDTIVVNYKETRKYIMAMPNFAETLTTSLGGNMLPSNDEESGMTATAMLTNDSPEFNFWDDLETTLVSIVQCDGCPPPVINRTTGIISVSASRRIHRDVEEHLSLLRRESYKQVIIEAKIIEVALTEGSEKGIDWEGVFNKQGFEIGVAPDGGGLLWSKDTGWNRFLDSLTIVDTSWDIVVSAFEQFGDTRIISNPKVHILNGHGAVLSSGQVRTYLDGCSVTVSGDFG
ncbi:MAG: hypothetical protein JRG75_05055, partial [Deltaproteobacteria bacterium]|nr:hypothetical protein [Deltaproteobacteria bacterium]